MAFPSIGGKSAVPLACSRWAFPSFERVSLLVALPPASGGPRVSSVIVENQPQGQRPVAGNGDHRCDAVQPKTPGAPIAPLPGPVDDGAFGQGGLPRAFGQRVLVPARAE